MAQRPCPYGHRCDHHRQRQPDFMNSRRQQKFSTDAQGRDKHDTGKAMDRTERRQRNADAVYPFGHRRANRGKGNASHLLYPIYVIAYPFARFAARQIQFLLAN